MSIGIKKRKYCEWLYVSKSDNLEEMNKFLETSPPKPNQEEISNLNRLITRSENRICHTHTYSLQAEVLDPMAEQENSTKHTKKNLYQFFPNSSKRLKRKEHPQRHSMKSPSPWYPNQTKMSTRQEKYRPIIFDEYRCKNSQQNISKPNPTIHTRIIHHE